LTISESCLRLSKNSSLFATLTSNHTSDTSEGVVFAESAARTRPRSSFLTTTLWTTLAGSVIPTPIASGKCRCGSGPTCSILGEQQQPPRQNSIRFLGRPDRARQDPGTRQNLTLRWPRSRASYYDPATKNRSSP